MKIIKICIRKEVFMYNQEQLIVRELAKELQCYAEQDSAKQVIKDWKAHNALRGTRSMILLHPEAAVWENDLLTSDKILCQDPLLRQYEYALRQKLYMAKVIKDDTPITTNFNINHIVNESFYGEKLKLVETRTRADGSFHYEKCIEDIEEEFHKLEYRTVQYDETNTKRNQIVAEETFGDILNVRLRGAKWWTLGLTWEVIKLIGLEDLMINMYDDPEGLHKLLGWISKEHLHFIEEIQKIGVLSPNNEDDGIASGGYGCTDELLPNEDHVDFMQMWGFAESQETVGISPDMFGEFVFPYQLPILEKFGLNCYGCCEPIENRWKWISTIPRLRRLSVSPWSNVDAMREILGKDYIYSRKPSPANICCGFDETVIREDLEHVMAFQKDINLEVIMKDVQTLQGDPRRAARWVEIARETARKYE